MIATIRRRRATGTALVVALAVLLTAVVVSLFDARIAAAQDDESDAPIVEVLSASVLRGVDVPSWFGASSDPVIQLTVENPNDTAVTDLLPAVWIGGEVFYGERLSGLEPGQRTTVDVPVHLSAFDWGRITMRAEVGRDSYEIRTWQVPWGLLALAALVVHLGVLVIRNRVRAAVQREVAAATGAAEAPTISEPDIRRLPPMPSPSVGRDGRVLPTSARELRSIAGGWDLASPYDEAWDADPWVAPDPPGTAREPVDPWYRADSSAAESAPA